MLIISIFSAIIIFSIIVLIHECGHYFSAKRHGVKIEEFGLGLPPRAKTLWTNKSGTKFTLNWIPFGGFVRMFGENGGTIEERKQKGSFGGVSLLGRMEIVLAGVFMNFILAWGILIILFTVGTQPIILSKDDFLKYKNEGFIVMEKDFDGVKILNNPKNFLTQKKFFNEGKNFLNQEKNFFNGEKFFQKGDIIKKINGKKILDGKNFLKLQKNFLTQKNFFNEGKNFFKNFDKNYINYEILKISGEKINLKIKISDIEKNFGKLGVEFTDKSGIEKVKNIKLNFFNSIGYSFNECFRISISTVKLFGEMIGKIFGEGKALEGVSGPVGIAKAAGGLVEEGDFNGVLKFMALISLSLAVMNILPIPALDGGRFMFLIIEGIIRRPLSDKLEGFINLFGYIFLMGLLIFITIKDVLSIF